MEETPRVLIVDDDEPIRKMLALHFELDGFEVASAGDGLEAIIQVGLFLPDVVVLDIMMPRMDGLTALGHLRRQVDTAELPVVLLSAKADSTDIAIGLRAGATDYVTKPFEADDLLGRVRRAIAAHAAAVRAAEAGGIRNSTSAADGADGTVVQHAGSATVATSFRSSARRASSPEPGSTPSGPAWSTSVPYPPVPPPPPPLGPTTIPAIPPPPQNLPAVTATPLPRPGTLPIRYAQPGAADDETSTDGPRPRQLVAAAILVLLILVAGLTVSRMGWIGL